MRKYSNHLGKVFNEGGKVVSSAGFSGVVLEISEPAGFFRCVYLYVRKDKTGEIIKATSMTLTPV